MQVKRHKRQILLFLIAILLPAAVLVALGTRTVIQERELAVKRATDRRRDALDQLRRELVAGLEAIKLQEINLLMRSPGVDRPRGSENPAVILAARLDGDHLIPPWETGGRQDPEASPEFGRYRDEGEGLEFAKKDNAGAAAAYRRALASAQSAREVAEARILLARVLGKSGNIEEASRLYTAVLQDDREARDEQGVAYRLYAAERLVQEKRNVDGVRSFLDEEPNGARSLTLPELYMIRSLLTAAGSATDSRAAESLARRIAQMEQIAALRRSSRVCARRVS